MIEEQGSGADGRTLPILPDNWEAACIFFFEMPTQWRRQHRSDDQDGAIVGLRYDALELVIRHHRCADPDDVFQRIQVLERSAVEQVRRITN